MYYPFMFNKGIELAKKLQNDHENIDEICTYISGRLSTVFYTVGVQFLTHTIMFLKVLNLICNVDNDTVPVLWAIKLKN